MLALFCFRITSMPMIQAHDLMWAVLSSHFVPQGSTASLPTRLFLSGALRTSRHPHAFPTIFPQIPPTILSASFLCILPIQSYYHYYLSETFQDSTYSLDSFPLSSSFHRRFQQSNYSPAKLLGSIWNHPDEPKELVRHLRPNTMDRKKPIGHLTSNTLDRKSPLGIMGQLG